MTEFVKVCRGVFIFRSIAATRVPADQTDPQMYPFVAASQTVFAAVRTWINAPRLIEMRTISGAVFRNQFNRLSRINKVKVVFLRQGFGGFLHGLSKSGGGI